MEINARMVKELRECTGAGMMDCKKALAEAGGDVDAAVDILRTKGLAALAKKAGRATNEGVIAGHVTADARVGALAEVNCETDFVALNTDFRAFADDVAAHVAATAPNDTALLLASEFKGDGLVFESVLGETIARIGENIQVARFERFELSTAHGGVAVYIHGVGKIGVMVEVASSSDGIAASEVFALLCRDIAMQVAAASPVAVRRDDVDPDVVSRELSIYAAQAAESGKPEAIREKIAAGRLEKFFKEVCLLEQEYVKNPDLTVDEHISRVARERGGSIEVVRFVRYVLGESTRGLE